MRVIKLFLLIGLINNYGNAISDENGISKEGSEEETEKTPEINNNLVKYDPFSHVYVFKYDLSPLVDEETNVEVPSNHRKLDFSMKMRSDVDRRYSNFIIAKHLSGRRKADVKYLENLMAHPTWFTVFTVENPKDFHTFQLKHPVLKNIEKIQQFYKKFLAQAMCMTSKEHSQEPASDSFLPKSLRYQQNPFFHFNESNYDKTLYRGDIRKKMQQGDKYSRIFNNKNNWYNRFLVSSCTSLPVRNRWISSPKNATEELYGPEMNDDSKIHINERNIGYNNYCSNFPENVPSFVDNPSGIDSNIKAIFGNRNVSVDEDYLSAHGKSEVDNSEETI